MDMYKDAGEASTEVRRRGQAIQTPQPYMEPPRSRGLTLPDDGPSGPDAAPAPSREPQAPAGFTTATGYISPYALQYLSDMPEAAPAPEPTRSYLGAAAEAGGRSLLAAGARIIDALNPFTISEEELSVLMKDDPAQLKEFTEKSAAMALDRFAKEQTRLAQEAMKNAGAGERGAISGRPIGELEYATTDPNKAAYLSPTRVAGDVLQSLPSTLALAVTAYLTRGKSLQAAEQTTAQALARGATAEEAKLLGRQAAIEAGANTMAKVGAASEGAMSYGTSYNQTRDAANDVTQAQLDSSPDYQALLQEGFSPEAARANLSARAGREAGVTAGAIVGATNMVGGQVLGRVIGQGGNLLARTGKGALTEAATEMVQSPGEQLSQNLALQTMNPQQSATEGLLEATVAGGVVGGVTGGAASAVFGSRQRMATSKEGNVEVSYPVDEAGDPVRNEALDKAATELRGAVDQYVAPPAGMVAAPNLDTVEGATNYLQQIVNQAPASQQVDMRNQLINKVVGDIEARGGVASAAEAAFLKDQGMGQPYDRIDPRIPDEINQGQPSSLILPAGNNNVRADAIPNNADNVASAQRQEAIRAERQAADAARLDAAIASTSQAPATPDVKATLEALKVSPALRTAEEKLTVDQARSRFDPTDFEILQRQAINGASLTTEERLRIQQLQRMSSPQTAPATAPAESQAAPDATVEPTVTPRRSSEPVDLTLPAPVPQRGALTPDQRIERAAAKGRLAQQPKGVIITSDAKMSTRRRAVPGATIPIRDGETEHNVTVVPNSKLGARGKLLEQIGRLFGKRLVTFSSDTLQADGFVLPDDNTNIFVNAQSQISPLAVFGHELLHQLKRDNPQAYIALEAVIRRNMRNNAEIDAEYDGYNQDARVEEVTADLVGNRFQDPDFWGDVFSEIESLYPRESRGIISRLVDTLVKAVSAFRNAVNQSGFRADEFVNNLDEVTKAIKDTFVQYTRDQRTAAQEMEAGLTPRSSVGDNVSATNIGSQNAKFTNARPDAAEPNAAGRDRQNVAVDGADQEDLPGYGTPREGAVSAVGRHYSNSARDSLSADYYGTGLRGAERHRLDNSLDQRIRRRIYFYVDNGNGITPESGVGGFAHEVRLNNLYDPSSKLIPTYPDANQFEAAVIDAGFDGYISKGFGKMDAVVLLGTKHKAVPVKALGRVADAVAQPVAEEPATLRKSLLSRELRELNQEAIPGAAVNNGGLEIPASSKELANAELERIGSPVRFSRVRAIPESIDSYATLSTVVPRAREGTFNRNRDLKVSLQEEILRASREAGVDLSAQNAETEAYLTRVGVADALYAIQSNANAVGWYDKTVTKALRVLGAIHPEINTDPNSKFAFTWALAVTSNGLKVDKNFELAERSYRDYKRTGRMPTDIKAGQAQGAINEGLGLFNEMVDKYGIDDVRKFMETNFTVAQIKRATGLEITGEAAETTVRGAAILGPKIGNGFFSNLNGFFDQLTMDRWLMRTWGRWTGTLIENRPDMVRAKRAELRDLILEIKKDNKAAADFQKALGRRLVVGDLDAIALAIQKASMDPDTRKEFNKTKVGEGLRKTGNALAKYLDGQKEAPAGPDERNFIRKVFSQILSEVRTKGFQSLTMSDLQALLWYPEKRLYDIAKSDEDAKTGYSDDEAPDYANAAIKLARSNGVSDSDIQDAIRTAEQEYETRNSAGSAGRDAANEQAEVGTEGGVRGFAPRERRQFLTTGIVHRLRSDRAGSEESPGAYERRSGGDGKGVRVLGQPSVAVYSPAVTFKNALGRVPAAAPKFFEVGAESAQLFQDSIQAAKDSSPFGAAVYVYPIESYRGMRMFLSEDGKAGFALNGDDIVSVFSGEPHTGGVNAIMQLAIQEGGRRLDAFDTVLPELYAVHGFKAVARTPWNDAAKPDDWNKSVFRKFKNGEPDVVFMVYDKDYFGRYEITDGEVIQNYDDGAVRQAQALGSTPATTTAPVNTEATPAADTNAGVPQAQPQDGITASRRRQVDTPEFKRWFGDSKVVDENGEPLVVYHGTIDRNTGPVGVFQTPSFFSPSTEFSSQYASEYGSYENGAVYPVYLSLQNPFRFGVDQFPFKRFWRGLSSDDKVVLRETVASSMDIDRASADDVESALQSGEWGINEEPTVLSFLESIGYDGASVREDGIENWIAFRPEQIKSATGNNGNFDQANPGITMSRRRKNVDMGTVTRAQEQALRNVGGIIVEQTAQERLADLGNKFKSKWFSGIFDQFAEINTVDQKAYMLARLSKGADGTLEAAMLYGQPFVNADGVADVDIQKDGFAKILASVRGEHDKFLWWVAAQRAERLKANGLENLFSNQDISALKSLNQGTFEDGTSRAQVYADALTRMIEFNNSVIDVAIKSDLIDPAAGKLFKDLPYVPFYRVMEDGVDGPSFSSGLTSQEAFKKLKGGDQKLNNDLLGNLLMNWAHLFSASAKNRAAVATMDAAENMQIATQVPRGTKNAVKIRKKGLETYYTIDDPHLLEAVSAIEYQMPGFFKPLATVKRWLTFGVTISPEFKMANLMRDSISSIATAELEYNPAANIKRGFAALDPESQTYASMLAGGALIRFGSLLEGTESKRARRLIEKEGAQYLDKAGWERLAGMARDTFETYQEFGDKIENVNRAALYDRLIEKGYSSLDANFMARDLMDFSLQGRWPLIRFLASTVPFLNARLQGLSKLGRGAKQDVARFGYVVGAVALASTALMLAYEDDEDWKKREDWDRDSNWWFKIGNTAFRIPKPFEVGAIGTLAERTWEVMFNDDMTWKRYRESISRMLFSTFAMDPTPQAIKPIADVYANREGFGNRPIEGVGMDRLMPSERKTENTSAVAELLGGIGLPNPASLARGKYEALSPVQIDYLVRGYFGWLGTSSLKLADLALRPMMGKGERPDAELKQMPLVGRFVESLPSNSSRYVTEIYDVLKDAEQAYMSYRQALTIGREEDAEKLYAAQRQKIDSYKALDRIRDSLAKIQGEIRRIEADKTLTGTQKRQEINELKAIQNEIGREVNDLTKPSPAK